MPVVKSKPPREGGSGRSWVWFDVPRSFSADAWIAGPTVWIESHFVDRTVPCVTEMTDGALACKYRHDVFRLIQVGYVPLFWPGGKREFVIVQDYARPQIDRMGMYVPVKITRGPGKYDEIRIIPLRSAGHVRDKSDPVQGHDITPALLHMWKDLEYERWCYQQLGAQPPPPPAPKEKQAAKVDGQQLSAEEERHLQTEAVLRRLSVNGKPLADGEVPWEDLVRGLRAKAEKNGKPKE